MIIGVPKEVKSDEYRVAMLPVGAEELVLRGHRVLVQKSAGEGSGLPDEFYSEVGAEMVDTAEEVFASADMIVKVKEPQSQEWPLIRPGQTVFTYFHFAASRDLTEAMRDTGATSVAYETLANDNGSLPLLTPMSEVAGRMSIQEGAKYLRKATDGPWHSARWSTWRSACPYHGHRRWSCWSQRSEDCCRLPSQRGDP